MNDHFLKMARKVSVGFCLAMICGGFTACTDDYDLDDEGSYPSWLGSSIYEALKNPKDLKSAEGNVLEGTFTNYLRLIDDLGYAETLGRPVRKPCSLPTMKPLIAFMPTTPGA